MAVAANGSVPESALLASIVDQVNTGLILLDAASRICLWNEWMRLHTDGAALPSPLGQHITERFPESQGTRLHEAVENALTNGAPALLSPRLNPVPLPLYSWPRPAKPVPIPVTAMVRGLKLDGNPYCLIEIHDISQTMQRERHLRQKNIELSTSVYRDPLTSIANRRRFDEFIATEFRRAQRSQESLAIMMIDVDHFKLYNDHYGHPQGDTCLKLVASTINNVVQRAGDLVARYGGEEFVAVLPGTDSEGAALLGESLRYHILELQLPHAASKVVPQVTVSIGIAAIIPDRSARIETLVSAADLALYRAKRDGRNRISTFSRSTSTDLQNAGAV
jgi:diguanylate cyclase (GGDEF)-like protein